MYALFYVTVIKCLSLLVWYVFASQKPKSKETVKMRSTKVSNISNSFRHDEYPQNVGVPSFCPSSLVIFMPVWKSKENLKSQEIMRLAKRRNAREQLVCCPECRY